MAGRISQTVRVRSSHGTVKHRKIKRTDCIGRGLVDNWLDL